MPVGFALSLPFPRPHVWLIGAALLTLASPALSQPKSSGWVSVEYRALVDLRRPSQSGATIEDLLAQASGADKAARDRALDQLEPLLEPYAFVLEDAADALAPSFAAPMVELAALWPRGSREPAWVELLRARRYVVQSDGRGRMRVFVPWEDGPDPRTTPPGGDATGAARAAWQRHYGVLRHVVASELQRQRAAGQASPSVALAVHAFRHLPAESRFVLGTVPYETTLSAADPDGARPPLDLDAWRRFVDGGLVLEGARLTKDGGVVLFGSEGGGEARLLGVPMALSDYAVAYRAIFHGGRAAPYMSLDRSLSTHRLAVNHGGRLRDTMLGLVTMLCDVRFKTFSSGIDPWSGADDRERARAAIPGFRTHVEHLAASPESANVRGQQTRFWFYPDAVDLTLSPQGDVLVFRNARMSAASERAGAGAAAADPPWTRATVSAINEEYDRLARLYPELAGLDHVVRLLALFTWLRQADAAGLAVPELDALLAVDLPALTTPDAFPQQLTFNALPQTGTGGPVSVYGQSRVGRGLDRLDPEGVPPLPPAMRARRALAALDRSKPEHEAVARALESVLARTPTASELDRAAAEAERLVMHRLILGTLDADAKQQLSERVRAREELRVFSTAIGGLDLGMGGALARAAGRGVQVGWGGATPTGATPSSASPATSPRAIAVARPAPQPSWKREAEGLRHAALPEHAWPALPEPKTPAGLASETRGGALLQLGRTSGANAVTFALAVAAAYGPRPDARRAIASGKPARVSAFERLAEGRFLAYTVQAKGDVLTAALAPTALSAEARGASRRALLGETESAPSTAPASREGLMRVIVRDVPADAPEIALDLSGAKGNSSITWSREVARRIAMGPELELPNAAAIPDVSVPTGVFTGARTVVVEASAVEFALPWDGEPAPIAAETTAQGLARGLSLWWSRRADAPRAVVALAGDASAARLARAPRVSSALLIAPEDAFPPTAGVDRAAIAAAWGGSPVAASLEANTPVPELVVLVSAEPAAALGARLARLARDPRLAGKLLAIYPVATKVRADMPARLLAASELVGVGLAESRPDGAALAIAELRALEAALGRAKAAGGQRVEEQGVFLWHY